MPSRPPQRTGREEELHELAARGVTAGDDRGLEHEAGQQVALEEVVPWLDPLHPFGPALQEGDIDLETEAGRGRDGHRPVGGHLDRRHDDVPFEVAIAGRDVPGQGEAGQAREGQVVRAADAGLQHAAAPERARRARRKGDGCAVPRRSRPRVPIFMLTIRQAPVSSSLAGPVLAGDALVEADRRRARLRCRRAWSMRSSWASGCSIISRS